MPVVLREHPLVRRILAPNTSAFTYTGTQTYLVGERDVAVIDPGPDIAEHIEAIMAALDGACVRAIMCTHTHTDHSPAAGPLALRTGAPIIGCAPLTIADVGPRADAAFDLDYAPDRVLRHGERLAGAGWTLAAVSTPGHTSNHLCLALVEAKALFTGDHVLGWSTSIVAPPDGNMADYILSLERLLTREDTIYFPAHGEPIEHPQVYVRGLLDHRRRREAQICGVLDTAASTVPEMVDSIYVDLDPRLHGAACLSVMAHLLDLKERRLVVQDEARWRLAPAQKQNN